ncbi:MAG TPA: amidohydrolase family protein, partial [Candidatus Eisenbacteria bacterium]|nr:amidohydrolase family protein [Candidatus Eisenbacteria bacterium]
YPVYEKMVKSGIRNICIHKGLLPGKAETKMPGVTAYAGVDDVGKAAKDWPQLNFIIYHAAYNVLMPQEEQQKALEERGYVEWASDLAAIPETFKVENVYAEIGSSFGISAIMQPRFCAGMMGALVKGMGVDKIFWGTDSVWYGSPQWQIEAFRRMEIPENLQKKFGFTSLGDADGPVKRKILGENAARLYGIDVAKTVAALDADKLATARTAYAEAGAERSNLAYGFVNKRI